MAVRVVWFPIWHTLTTKTCLSHRPNQLCLKRPHDREATCFCSLMCEKVEFLNHAASESSRYVGPIWSQVWKECTLHDACTTIAAVILPNSDVRKKGNQSCKLRKNQTWKIHQSWNNLFLHICCTMIKNSPFHTNYQGYFVGCITSILKTPVVFAQLVWTNR